MNNSKWSNVRQTRTKEKYICDTKTDKKPVKHYDAVDIDQMSLFDAVKDEDILKELEDIDITNLTPVDALNTLYKLQNELKNRWKKEAADEGADS